MLACQCARLRLVVVALVLEFLVELAAELARVLEDARDDEAHARRDHGRGVRVDEGAREGGLLLVRPEEAFEVLDVGHADLAEEADRVGGLDAAALEFAAKALMNS